jgi:type I restriction enzyme S subunit
VDEKIAAEENRKRSLEVLFKTLLHDLMMGKLRAKDAVGAAHET